MAISYFDVWKKRMSNNGDIVQSRLNASKDVFNNNFKDDPSYKLATLRKKDTTIADSNLDTRVVNMENNTLKKKIYLRPDTNIDVGDYIKYTDKTYLVLAFENNLISPYAECQECNHLLKWMINGQYCEMLSFVTNKTKYTLGIQSEVAGITEEDSRLSVDLPYNNTTKKILSGQRFIINNQAWKVTQIDFTSTKGLLSILLGQSSINEETDDIQNEIADVFLHSYSITLNSTSQSIQVGGTYQINMVVKDNNEIITNPSNITYTSSDTSVATVSNGLVTAIKEGNATITVVIGDVSTTMTTTVVSATSNPVTSYGYNWSNGTNLKTYMSSTITLTKTINSVSSQLVVSYALDSVGTNLLSSGVIAITKKSDSSYQVKNISVSSAKSFTITFTDADSSVISEQVIQLTGM